jgi:hypothetical protein
VPQRRRPVVVSQDVRGEGCSVAADGRPRISGTLVQDPLGVAARTLPVARENSRLEHTDQASPASRGRVRVALAVTLGGPDQPAARLGLAALHEASEPGPAGRHRDPEKLPLPRVGVIGEARRPVAVARLLALGMRLPIHGHSVKRPITRTGEGIEAPIDYLSRYDGVPAALTKAAHPLAAPRETFVVFPVSGSPEPQPGSRLPPAHA